MDSSLLKNKSPLSGLRIILLLLHYLVGYIFIYPMVAIYISVHFFQAKQTLPQGVQWGLYIFVIIVTVLLAWPLLKESYKSFKNKEIFTLKTAIISYVGLYFVMFLSSLVISSLTSTTTSANQQEISKALTIYPALQVFVAVIFAPIVEEIIFRGCLFRVIRAKWSFLLSCAISFISFGFLHVFQSLMTQNFVDLWYLLPYGFSAYFMCRCYEKTENIYGSMLLHLINNMISMFVMLQLAS